MLYNDKALAEVKSDPRFLQFNNLPSNFYAYEFKELWARPMTVSELMLISKAYSLGDMSYVVRAVDRCITQTADDLTIGDFYFILMWMKIHSTPKAPYVIEWHCKGKVWKNLETLDLILNDETYREPGKDEGYTLVDCGCHNSEIVHITDVDIIQLPEEGWTGLPEGFDFPRARILQEVRDSLKDPELRFIVGPAQWVKATTLKEKIDILVAQTDLDMFEQATSLNKKHTHGIAEHTVLHCRNCRASYPHEIELEPYSFFR